MNPTEIQDSAQIVKSFQKKLLSSSSEAASIGSMLNSVSTMQVNAVSVSENLTNAISPPIPEPVLQALSTAANASSFEVDIGIDTDNIPGSDNQLIAMGLEWLENCIPCNFRIKFRLELVQSLSDAVLSALEQMLEKYLNQLDVITNLLNLGDVYQDGCLLLKSMQQICIPDIQRMISLFSAMLYRTTTKEVMEETDSMKMLIQPFFQPIFTNIVQLLSQYQVLVTDPLNCVVSSISAQIENIKTGGFLESNTISSLEERADDLADIAISGGATKKKVDYTSPEFSTALRNAKMYDEKYDEKISRMQDSLGSALSYIRNMTMVGIAEVDSILQELVSELEKFVGNGQDDTLEFLMKQYDKIIMIRTIVMLGAMVVAFANGFTCDFDNKTSANNTLTTFFDQYLGPQSSTTVQVDPVTNEVSLKLTAALDTPESSVSPLQSEPVNLIITGDTEVNDAISAIIRQSTTGATIKPKCFFEAQTSDDDKLAEYLAKLNAIEV